ncbi:FAD-dependent oxidoreductase [Aspergillus alliaceus]|uniref:FAD-dependent oxidoreductase n=1 Tax=Petromyces alliaceus TaxID=209559 RepID=UPI0012A5A415|nr:D-amino-acid oxidase [Aspergillus alliaceus]KAB8227731.1 D-amino-acid oxidase [Aspergillus alliaceus]
MEKKNVVVIGAGVAGLTTASLLSRNPKSKIVVAAKHMPGDYDIEYTSTWAGANCMPMSTRGTKAADWDRRTWIALEDLARNHPDAGIHFQECEIHTRSKDVGSTTAEWFGELLSLDPWFEDVIPNFRTLSKNNLGPGIDSATAFTSLVSQCLKNGVKLKRAIFRHISDAASSLIHPGQEVDLVVNCTGLMASKLGGVEDKTVVPAREQIVIVRNTAGKMLNVSGTDDGDSEACYESQVDPNLAIRIMKRAVKMCPQLTGGKGIEHLDIVRNIVGLRPVRQNGTRIEKERIGDTWVVHNYGAGGAGYQSSYGCAQAAVDLVEDALATRARL